MTLIGIEEHWTLDRVDNSLRALPTGLVDDSLVLNQHGDAGARLRDLGALRTDTMDRQGVDMHVLSLAPPGAQVPSPRTAVSLCRDANDTISDAVRSNPRRFRGMATLPLADPAAAAAELERATALGLTGVMVYGRVGEVPLDDPRFGDLWAVAEQLRQPVFIHPQIPPDAVRRAAYRGLGDPVDLALATFGWGWHVEAGTAALRLMASGALDRHPDLRLVLGHWGELLLFWHGRADGVARSAGLDRTITEYLRQNVWITASGMLDRALLDHALTVTTPDRILFSTDYPFQVPTRQEIDEFLLAFPDRSTRDAFTSGNARHLFGIPEEAGGPLEAASPLDT
ncbi:amidohydrolase family protein [Actinokineospora sp. PR83]|uniref:amidohydrolase family protein n=1 Tax=Actinokineospora sp. PR83 TaxID=2884908 RepID=UPI0027E18280|nr:amidohydrolase family protein [Actinokineospora sp. PR83]MCG8914499.1 amidohydrolase family protein [Actinokineospora sp. PR83]